MKLTDEQIMEIVREASKGSAMRRDGSTSMRIARAIEAAVQAQGEPVAWRSCLKYSPDVGEWYEYYDQTRTTNDYSDLQPLFAHTATVNTALLEACEGVAWMAKCGQLDAFIGEPWLNAVFAAIAQAEGKV